MQKNKRIFFFIFFLYLFCFLFNVNAQEVKREWRDKNFDIKKIRTVLLMPTVIKFEQSDRMLPVVLTGMVTDKFNDRSVGNKLHFISLEEALAKIKLFTGEDLAVLKQTDLNRYNALLAENLYKVCDAVLTNEVTLMGTETFSYKKTVYETVSYDQYEKISTDDSKKTKTKTSTVTIPVEKTVTAERINAGMEFTLLNVKTNQPIWYILDNRERVNDYVGMTMPEDMFKRIIDRTCDRFKSIL